MTRMQLSYVRELLNEVFGDCKELTIQEQHVEGTAHRFVHEETGKVLGTWHDGIMRFRQENINSLGGFKA